MVDGLSDPGPGQCVLGIDAENPHTELFTGLASGIFPFADLGRSLAGAASMGSHP